ncbi:restriction endonuclease subunit S [Kribbella sp. NPDC049174]|uniref:restriction endonuclease subunit S n=1 Tax=Kribbella sp. NPDC049174 TaxID=3364112 RepID=UPI0037221EBE
MWSTVPTRRLFRVINGGTPTADAENWDGEVQWATPVDLAKSNGLHINTTKRSISRIGLAKGSGAVPRGSLIISTRAPIGYVSETVSETAFNQGCRGLIPTTEVDIRFYRYQYFALSQLLAARGLGSTFMELSTENLAAFDVSAPPLAAQRIIADFLDAETARIDTLVAKKIKLVNLVEEKIECRIRQRMADSGLAGTKGGGAVTTIRQVLAKLDRPASLVSETVTAFRDGQVTARSRRRLDGYTESWTESSRLQGVHEGDVVVHGLDGFAGAIGTSEADGVCSPVYHVCTPKKGGDPVYLGRMLHVLATDGYLGLFSSSTRERAVDFRNWDLFGRIPVPQVPLPEQRIIAEMIKNLSPLKDAVARSADLARERKQALIAAVVSGEMNVPGVSR